MKQIGLARHLSHQYIVKVAANLIVFTGHLYESKPNRNLVSRTVSLSSTVSLYQARPTKQLQPHDPKHWVVSKLPYPYNPLAKAPRWEQYKNHLCSGHNDRVEAEHGYGAGGWSPRRCVTCMALRDRQDRARPGGYCTRRQGSNSDHLVALNSEPFEITSK